jgi:hypothetical protein
MAWGGAGTERQDLRDTSRFNVGAHHRSRRVQRACALQGTGSDCVGVRAVAESTDTSTMGGLSGYAKWHGAVLARNGKIYGMPYNSPSVLIIDPAAGTASTTVLTGLASGGYKYYGGVLAPSGLIYGIPFNAESVLIIDPFNNTLDTVTLGVYSALMLSQSARVTGIYRVLVRYSLQVASRDWGNHAAVCSRRVANCMESLTTQHQR